MITSITGMVVADVPPKGGCSVDGGGGAGLLVALVVGLALLRRRR